MSHIAIGPPEPAECATYYSRYISLVQGNDILKELSRQRESTAAYLRSIPAAKENFSYAPGKWTVKQVLFHINDTERLFAYRALSFARQDPAALPGMEQEDWMNGLSADAATLKDLVDEFACVRQSTIHFFTHLSNDAWMRKGIASDNPFTVRSLAYIIAGHEQHHLNVLKAKYA